jgi:hypothetical protein
MGDHTMMNTGRLLLGVAVLVLSACNREADPAPQALHFKIPSKRGPTPQELTAGMVEAVTVGKSSVPVYVKFDIPERPVVGHPIEVIVAVMPQISAEHAVLSVSASDELSIAQATVAPIDMPSVEPDQVYRHNIKITPSAEGVQVLGLNVALKHDETTETRVFSIPVIVAAVDGTPTAKR